MLNAYSITLLPSTMYDVIQQVCVHVSQTVNDWHVPRQSFSLMHWENTFSNYWSPYSSPIILMDYSINWVICDSVPLDTVYYKYLWQEPLTKFCSSTTFFWRQSKLASLFSWQHNDTVNYAYTLRQYEDLLQLHIIQSDTHTASCIKYQSSRFTAKKIIRHTHRSHKSINTALHLIREITGNNADVLKIHVRMDGLIQKSLQIILCNIHMNIYYPIIQTVSLTIKINKPYCKLD